MPDPRWWLSLLDAALESGLRNVLLDLREALDERRVRGLLAVEDAHRHQSLKRRRREGIKQPLEVHIAPAEGRVLMDADSASERIDDELQAGTGRVV